MTDAPLSRRLFIAKAAPLVVATTMPVAASLAAAAEPVEHMRAIIGHFAGLAPDGADRIMLQVGGTPDSFGYVAHAVFSRWVPDTRLRGGGYWRDDARELSRRSWRGD